MTSSGSDFIQERTLMRDFAAGKVEALGTLYDRLGGTLFALAARITGDREQAGRVVEQLFAETWSQRARWRDAAAAPVTELFARCRAIALATRGAQTGTNAMSDGAAAHASVALGSPRLLEALANLPATAHRALELAYFDGLSLVEIAERTRLGREQVLGQLRQALNALRPNEGAREVRS